MLGNYKLHQFNAQEIQALAEQLDAAGIHVNVTWKKRNKPVSDPMDGATGVEFRLGDEWILRQNGAQGNVRLNKVPAAQQTDFLRCMKEQEFYSAPQWGLGFALFGLYWLVLLLVMSAYPGGLGTCVFVGGLAVTVSLGVLALSATTHVPTPIWWFFMILGGVGYFVTTLYSLLAIGMIKAILVNNHYQNIALLPDGQLKTE